MNLSLGKKLGGILLILTMVAIVPFTILAVQSIRTAKESFVQSKFEQLAAINQIKKNQITSYFNERLGDIAVLAANPDVIAATQAFSKAFAEEGGKVGGPSWLEVEKKYGPWLATYRKTYGYYDLFLINKRGDVVYTVVKEPDLGQSLRGSELKDSALAKAYQGGSRGAAFADFMPYAPSNGDPASFVAKSISVDGQAMGAVALQIPLDAINHIMQERTGMGKTGETYIVGADLLMRSDSYLDPNNHSVRASFARPQTGKVDTDASRQALSGSSGNKILIDYNGNPVLSVYSPLEVGGVKWAIIAEMDEAEVIQDSVAARNLSNMVLVISLVSGVIILAVLGLSIAMTFSIIRSLNSMADTLDDGAQQIASASGQVAGSSQSLAEGSSQQAASLEETSASLEELASMADSNADNARQADDLMRDTARIVGSAGQTMQTLGGAVERITANSDEMAKIIKTIDEIAFQTNLLALNAAVEAARAGEAGSGFAVVADEVRSLAMRAAEAAKSTSGMIEHNVGEIESLSRLMSRMSDDFGGVEQSAAKVAQIIGEIANASGEQTQGIEQINQAISEMDRVTQTTASSAEESAAASEQLSAQSESMRALVVDLNELVRGAAANQAGNAHEDLPGQAPGQNRIAQQTKLLQ